MIKIGTIIYLQIGSTTYTIPVNPTEFKNTYPTDNSDYKVLGLGQVMVPLKPDLQVVSWDSYFPAVTDLVESPNRLKGQEITSPYVALSSHDRAFTIPISLVSLPTLKRLIRAASQGICIIPLN